jgi:hypothetical protein
VLTQQLQEPITESAQEDKYIHSKENNNNNKNKDSIHFIIIIIIIQFNSFIYVLDNSQKGPITAKH